MARFNAQSRVPITELAITQESLRKSKNLPLMIEYVRSGGTWTLGEMAKYNESLPVEKRRSPDRISLVKLVEFPDGLVFIHDGHHRILATYLAGRDYLLPGEFVIEEKTYERYNSVLLDLGFVTPFDPRSEVRKADFGDYKTEALKLSKEDPEAFESYVRTNRRSYCSPRTRWYISEIAVDFTNAEGVRVLSN